MIKKWLIMAGVIALSACGGGGGGGSTTVGTSGTNTGTSSVTQPNPLVAFVDSFGNDIVPEGFGGSDSGADGTAGDGAPIVGGTVTIVDSKGLTATTTTNSKGYYRIKLNNFTPPLLAQVKGSTGNGAATVTRYSVNTKSLKAGSLITLNMSPLTSKIASDAAVALGQSDASKLTATLLASGNASTAISSAVTTSLASLRSQLASVIVAAGLNPATFNPIDVPFYADQTGYDYVLDNVSLSTPTSITIKSSFTGTTACPFAGTYSGSISGGDTGTFTATVSSTCQLSAFGTTTQGGSVVGSGSVTSTGVSTATMGGSTSTGAVFNGTIVNHVFSGKWSNAASGMSGTFSAR